MGRRQRTTTEERAWVVSEWEASGQSAATFARTMGIAMCTLYGWRRQLRAQPAASEEVIAIPPSSPGAGNRVHMRTPGASFAEVVLRAPAEADNPGRNDGWIEISIDNAVIRVGSSFDDEHLRRVINVLREAP